MSWTPGSKRSSDILYLGKYLSETFETLEIETARHYAKDLRKKLVAIVITSVPDLFNGFHEMQYNSANSRIKWSLGTRRQKEFLNSSLKILVFKLVLLVPGPNPIRTGVFGERVSRLECFHPLDLFLCL